MTMRAHSTVDRNYSSAYKNGPCPVWMKTLEDKYKRLHLKIVFNTSANSRRYTKPAGALSTISCGNYRNQPRFNKISQRLDVTPIHGPQPSASQNAGNKNEDVIKNTLERQTDSTDGKHKSKNDKDFKASDEEFTDKTNVVSDQLDLNADMDYRKYSFRKGLARNDKTSVQSNSGNNGRTDQNTVVSKTKSCPAVLQRQQEEPIKIREPMIRDEPKRQNRKMSKLFQQMSKEAQTAINETREDKREIINDNENMCLFNNSTNSIRTPRTDIHCENHYKTYRQLKFDRPKSCAPRYSMSSSSSTSSATYNARIKNTTRLPEITSSRTDSTLQSIGQKNVLVPGVGKYQIPIIREQTFQVTGTEYDIRYREVINCERRDSVTPPSDILDQAIMKCQEWITKYAVYAKR